MVCIDTFWRALGTALLLAVAGLPGQAVAAAPPLEAYGKLPALERVAMSPSGERIAMIGDVEGVRRLVVLDQQKKPLIVVPVEDAKVRGLYWAGEDRVLAYKSDTKEIFGFNVDRAEFGTMVVIPLDGSPMWQVFGKYPEIRGGVQSFRGIQQRGGKYYGYFVGNSYTLDPKDTRQVCRSSVLYEVDLQTQKASEIAPCFLGGYRTWVVGPDGTVQATMDFTSLDGKWIVRNAKGDHIAEGTSLLGDVGLVGLGATPGTVIYSETPKNGDTRWFEVPLAGGEAKEILADSSLDESFFDSNTRRFTGYRQQGDIPAYTFFDPFRQKVINAAVKAFPGVSVQLQDWNDAFDKLVVMTEGPGDPQTWWTVDIRTGNAAEIGNSYLIGSADVGPMKMVHYKAGDGLDIPAVLTLPPGREAKGLPVVVLPHGGPHARDYPAFDWWAQAFASRGYAVLQPNFRGSSGYGDDFRRAGHGEWGRKMQTDLSDGLAYLAQQGIVDARRACIVGASYGGYAALAGVTLQQGLYRCAVAVSGVSDVAKMSVEDSDAGSDPLIRRALKEELGAFKDLRAVSPINFADKADAPILLIHGKDDTVVKYEQSKDMAAALQQAGKAVELVTLAREDHWLSRSETRLAMIQAVVAFVEKWNPADHAP
ncbi:alpha/beta hydrolase family protein [Novosphingobium cyanobacteriorum]|uniref:S9 family peptidase n=1 Tax=Novosphingobium cyanobacteriorum TaxID=3024215 RepID=A0ABT6CFI3_9SPHN|nr:S9 family peptidase [Novosphingobium cyanobacteriorum]MDF8332676.1 S9 family peptidase [Novosphingobium cyanobacteriorum]